MLSIQLIRQNPDLVRQALANRGEKDASLEDILRLDSERRKLLHEAEQRRAERREGSRRIGQLLSQTHEVARARREAEDLKQDMRDLGDLISRAEKLTEAFDKVVNDLLLTLPNIPDPSVPVGQGEESNKRVREWGELREFEFTPLPHWELGERLGIIDFERGIKLSGSRFYVLKGAGALLQRALIAWMIDLHVREHGYTEVYPPFMVKRECMVGSGNLPKFADNLYHDEQDDFWFVPTAEVPLTGLHRDEILESLPVYYVAYTACFRREKLSAGKDTRGIKRGHQFDKVEMYKFTSPQTSNEELEKMVDNAEDVCRRLGLPHHVVQLCTGELGFASAKSYDIELWAPGCGEWLEVSSCSNCTDFQARRANIRYRPEPGARPQFVHTLNGSGVALPRLVISLLENYQQADGSVVVPQVLRPYMGGLEVIRSGC